MKARRRTVELGLVWIAGCSSAQSDSFELSDQAGDVTSAMLDEKSDTDLRHPSQEKKPCMALPAPPANPSTSIYGRYVEGDARAYYDLSGSLRRERELNSGSMWASLFGPGDAADTLEAKHVYRFLAVFGEFKFATPNAGAGAAAGAGATWTELDKTFEDPGSAKAIVESFKRTFPNVETIEMDTDLIEVNPETLTFDPLLFLLRFHGISLALKGGGPLQLEPAAETATEGHEPETSGESDAKTRDEIASHHAGPLLGCPLSEMDYGGCDYRTPWLSGQYCAARLLKTAGVDTVDLDAVVRACPPQTYRDVINKHRYGPILNGIIESSHVAKSIGLIGTSLAERLNRCERIGPLPCDLAKAMTEILEPYGQRATFRYHQTLNDIVKKLIEGRTKRLAPLIVVQTDWIRDSNALPLAKKYFTPNVTNLPKFQVMAVTRYNFATDTFTLVEAPVTVPVSESERLQGHTQTMPAEVLKKKWLWSTGSNWVDGQLQNVEVASGMLISIQPIDDETARGSATEM